MTDMKIAVISDTHNLLHPEVVRIIEDCDCVIHAGDFCSEKTYNELKNIQNTDKLFFAVRGNNDKWTEELPESIRFELCGTSFFVTHKKNGIPMDTMEDIIIFGHSHRYSEEDKGKQLFLNPGSCGRRRFNLPVTMALLYIEEGRRVVRRVEIADEGADVSIPKNLPKTVKNIMDCLDRGGSIEEISRRLRLDIEFVSQIARIKVTHPTADEYAIVNKIEANNRHVL